MNMWRAVPFFCVVVLLSGCEPELGKFCDSEDKADNVNALVEQRRGSDHLVQDLSFNNCTQAYCVSSDGSRPYCTRGCESDLDCLDADGFTCEVVDRFTPLGCTDWTVENLCKDSQSLLKYCVATRSVIEARDRDAENTWPTAEVLPVDGPDGGQSLVDGGS